jgi:hypothetical protein
MFSLLCDGPSAAIAQWNFRRTITYRTNKESASPLWRDRVSGTPRCYSSVRCGSEADRNVCSPSTAINCEERHPNSCNLSDSSARPSTHVSICLRLLWNMFLLSGTPSMSCAPLECGDDLEGHSAAACRQRLNVLYWEKVHRRSVRVVRFCRRSFSPHRRPKMFRIDAVHFARLKWIVCHRADDAE